MSLVVSTELPFSVGTSQVLLALSGTEPRTLTGERGPQGVGKGDSAILRDPRGLALVSCHRGWFRHEAVLLLTPPRHGPSPTSLFMGTTGPHPPWELNVPAPCFPSGGPLTPWGTFRRLALATGASVPGAGVPNTAVWWPWLAQGTEAQPPA